LLPGLAFTQNHGLRCLLDMAYVSRRRNQGSTSSLRLACSTRRRVVLQRPDVHDAVYRTTSRFRAHRCDVEASFHVAKSSVKNVLHIRCHCTRFPRCWQIPRRHPKGSHEEATPFLIVPLRMMDCSEYISIILVNLRRTIRWPRKSPLPSYR
jgi:hypothetical protein